jgi:hypothetical protein
MWTTRALLCSLLCVGLASQAAALSFSLTGVGASLNPAHTGDSGGRNGSTSDAGTPTGGGTDADALVGDTLGASNRYTATAWRTSRSLGTRTVVHDYQITFAANADVGVVFDLAITHDLEGLLQCDGDCAVSDATVTDVTVAAVSTTGIVGGDTGQATATSTPNTFLGSESTDIDAVAGLTTITGLTGNNTVTLNFSWTTTVTGERRRCGPGCTIDANGTAGFGIEPQFAPGYPGGNPDPNDGHFVDMLMTVTHAPEPSVASMLLLGLCGLAYVGRRRD